MMKNTSGLHPVGHAVLVRPYKPEDLIPSGSKLILPETVKQRQLLVENRAVVIEVGSECWIDEKEPRAKVGDHVYMTKMAGHIAIGLECGVKDGLAYRLINDRDIFCRIEVDNNG